MREVGALVAVCVVILSTVVPFAGVGVVSGAGSTITVNADGSGDHTTIQGGIDAAADGDTVEVQSGTYTETVTVGKNITLSAPNGATLNGSGISGDTVGIAVDPSVSTGLTIEGFTIEQYTDGITVGGDIADTATVGGWTIRDITVQDNTEDGLDIGETSTAAWTLQNITAIGNGDDGIEVGETPGGGPTRTEAWVISGVNASNNGDEGIFITDEEGAWKVQDSITNNNGVEGVEINKVGSGWLITNHTATSNDADGIAISSDGSGTVEQSNISDNRGDGFWSYGDSDWTLRDSLVQNNDDSGVYDSNTASSFLIDNVTIRGNGHDGVFLLDNSGDWQIRNSVIENNGANDFADPPGAGIDAERTSGTWIVNNTSISGNEDAGIHAVDAQVTGDATDNWWGQSSGPTSGQCEGNVDCSSPLTSDPSGPTTGGVQGTVTNASGDALSGIDVAVYRDNGTAFVEVANGTTKSDGTFSIDGIDAASGSADVKLEYAAESAEYEAEWYDDASSKATASTETVSAGATVSSLDAQLTAVAPGVVDGTVTNVSGGALSGMEVLVYRDDGTGTFSKVETVTTNATGEYSAEVLPPAGESSATIKAQFTDPNTDYRDEWYENTTDQSAATELTVASDGTVTANGVLEDRYGYVAGTVKDGDGNTLYPIEVTIFRDDGTGQFVQYDTATTDSNGEFDVAVEPPDTADSSATIKVRFSDSSNDYETAWHDDATDKAGATELTVTRGFRKTLLGTVLTQVTSSGGSGGSTGGTADPEPEPATFSGQVTDENGDPLDGIVVTAFREDATGQFVEVETAFTDANGRYTLAVDPLAGEDLVTARFRFRDTSWTYAQRWYDAQTEPRAETVTLREGTGRSGLDTTMEANVVTVAGTARSVDGDSLEDIRVAVYRRADDGRYVAADGAVTYTDEFGRYDVAVPVPDGETSLEMKVRFFDPDNEYATTYWRNGSTFDEAESFDGTAGMELPNVRVRMPEWEEVAVGYSGTVLNRTGPLEDVLVRIYRDDGTGTFRQWVNLRTDEAGYWETYIVPPEGAQTVSVKIRYRDEAGRYLEQWEFAEPNRSAAEVTTSDIGQFELLYGTRLEPAPTTRVSGQLFNESHKAIEDAEVTIYRKDSRGSFTEYATTTTTEFGYYEFDVAAPHDESTVATRLHFEDPSGEYADAWYEDSHSMENATTMTNQLGYHDRHNFQTLRKAGMVLDAWVQPLSTCADPTDEDSCTFPDREDSVTVDPNETVVVRYELWNGDDIRYRDYDVDDPATRTTMFGAGHQIAPGDTRSKVETLRAPIVDGVYDYEATSTSDDRNGTTSNSSATYTIEVSGSVAQQAQSPNGLNASVSGGGGEPVLIGGGDGVASTNTTTMQSLLLQTENVSYTLNVTGSETSPNGTLALPLAPGGTTLGYFTIDHSIANAAINNVTFRFQVDRPDPSNATFQPTDVTVYRYVDGTPTPLPTTLVEETAAAYIYEVASPGLSVFAVGTGDLTDPQSTDSATATAETTGTQTTDSTTETTTPGFGLGLSALALLIATVLLSRRR